MARGSLWFSFSFFICSQRNLLCHIAQALRCGWMLYTTTTSRKWSVWLKYTWRYPICESTQQDKYIQQFRGFNFTEGKAYCYIVMACWWFFLVSLFCLGCSFLYILSPKWSVMAYAWGQWSSIFIGSSIHWSFSSYLMAFITTPLECWMAVSWPLMDLVLQQGSHLRVNSW